MMKELSPIKPTDVDHVAPVLQAFSTPYRVLASESETQLLSTGEPETRSLAGEEIRLWSFGEGPHVLLVHDWNGRGSHLGHFVQPLVAAGFAVTLFDFPAHGDSTGTASNVVHMGRVLLSLGQSLGAVHGIIGHGAGSAAIIWAFNQGLSVQASVHISGSSSLSPMVSGFAKAHGLSREQSEEFGLLVEQFIQQPIKNADLGVLKAGLRHGGLIFHDESDRVVPLSMSEALHNVWANSEFIRTRSLGHTKILQDTDIISRSTQFLASTLT